MMKIRLSSYDEWSKRGVIEKGLDIAPFAVSLKSGGGITILPRLSDHRNITILGGDWLPVQADGLATYEWMIHTPSQFPGKSRVLRPEDDHYVGMATEVLDVDHELMLVGGSSNYYHWLVDYLPRLLLMEGIEEYDDWRFVVNHDLANHQIEAMRLLGITDERVVRISPAQAVRTPRAAVPTLLATTTLCHPAVPRLLKNAFPPRISGPSRRVYLSREDATSRRLVNENDLVNLLTDYGFEKHVSGTMSFQEQIDLFSTSDAIVSTHGAGMANIIFSRPGTRIFEISIKEWRVTSMAFLARICAQQHRFVDASVCHQTNPNPLLNDWQVDLDQMKAALDAHWPVHRSISNLD